MATSILLTLQDHPSFSLANGWDLINSSRGSSCESHWQYVSTRLRTSKEDDQGGMRRWRIPPLSSQSHPTFFPQSRLCELMKGRESVLWMAGYLRELYRDEGSLLGLLSYSYELLLGVILCHEGNLVFNTWSLVTYGHFGVSMGQSTIFAPRLSTPCHIDSRVSASCFVP